MASTAAPQVHAGPEVPNGNATKQRLLGLLAEFFCLRTRDAAVLLRGREITSVDERRECAPSEPELAMRTAPYSNSQTSRRIRKSPISSQFAKSRNTHGGQVVNQRAETVRQEFLPPQTPSTETFLDGFSKELLPYIKRMATFSQEGIVLGGTSRLYPPVFSKG